MSVLDKIKNGRLSLRAKFSLAVGAIAVVLLISSIISVMQYDRMSTYVSDIIGDDIGSINVAHRLSEISNRYNLDILAVIGDDKLVELPAYDDAFFINHCDSLKLSLASRELKSLTDSVEYSYSAYMLTSLELKAVLKSDFIDSRAWYFGRLQPRFERLNKDIDNLTGAIYNDLAKNSLTFDRGFYRSIIPGIVAVGVGLLLVLMLYLFLSNDYVKPVYKMLDSLNAYRSVGKQYSCKLQASDQISDLNDGIRELTNENIQLRKRLLKKQ